MVEITEVSGIGSNMAKEMEDAGFTSAELIAEADIGTLQSVKGVGPAKADELKEAAQEAVDESTIVTERVVATHYNARTGDYDKDIEYYCGKCGEGPFLGEATRDTHQQRCDAN